jgi:hypothetical protein
MRPLTSDDIFRIRVNSIYASTVASELALVLEPQMGEDARVKQNARAVQAGVKPWLESLLRSLQASAGGWRCSQSLPGDGD